MNDGFYLVHSGAFVPIMDRVVAGVFAEAQARSCPFFIERHAGPLTGMLLRQCAGLIGMVWRAAEADLLRRRSFPSINVSTSSPLWKGLGHVINDDMAIGRMAAEHLLERGYAHFLAVGQSGRILSRDRLASFTDAVKAAGARVETIEASGEISPRRWSPAAYLDAIWEWFGPALERLPLRAAVFAVSDWIAWPILRLLEQRTPGRLFTTAILGVDDLHDSGFDPRRTMGLSSVRPAFERLGREALAALMESGGDRDRAAAVMRRIPPERVVARASTTGPACEDPLTARIARLLWIAVRSGEPAGIGEIARRHGMTARTLERKFSRHVGRSAREFLVEARIEYARELLRETALSVGEIAERCGFADAPAFSNAFRRATGCSPREYARGACRPPCLGE